MHYELKEGVAPALAGTTAQLLEWARQHPRWLVITGAGCSTAVGIPAYRDLSGKWTRTPPVTYQAFIGDPYVRQRYWARSLAGWPVMGRAQPGEAHRALAELGHMGHISLLLTQNVDGLHQAAGSESTLDLHGRIDTVYCMECGVRFPRADWQKTLAQANPDWAGVEAAAAPDGDADVQGLPFGEFRIPACPCCNAGLLKPDVVFFGEAVPRERVQRAMAALEQVDGVLVAGSTLMVYSGFRFVQAAAQRGLSIVAINLGRTRADGLLQFKVEADVGTTLRDLAAALPLR